MVIPLSILLIDEPCLKNRRTISKEYFIIAIFCIVDDIIKALELLPLRKRSFTPALGDSEIITMEIVGEFMGLHEDNEVWSYFSRHWHPLFPKIPHRITFLRQAANLWHVKQAVQILLTQHLGYINLSQQTNSRAKLLTKANVQVPMMRLPHSLLKYAFHRRNL